MKLWLSGEVDSTIGDKFRLTMNEIEDMVNKMLAISSYGSGVNSWDVILIISTTPSKEFYKYKSKTKETDIHVIVEYQRFFEAKHQERKIMFIESLIKSIYILSDKYVIDDFNSLALISDLNKLKENAI